MGLKSILAPMKSELLPGVAYSVIVGTFLLSLRVPIYRDEAILVENRIAPILNRLPTQEGIGHVVNDIPDVGSVAHAGIGDCDYVPACP